MNATLFGDVCAFYGVRCVRALTGAQNRMARLPKDPRVLEYAAARGISKRTAQLHRQKNNSDWLQFIGANFENVEIIVQAISETAVVAGKTKELAMMDAAFETWQAIEGKKREAINRSRAEHLPALCKAEMESQEIKLLRYSVFLTVTFHD